MTGSIITVAVTPSNLTVLHCEDSDQCHIHKNRLGVWPFISGLSMRKVGLIVKSLTSDKLSIQV